MLKKYAKCMEEPEKPFPGPTSAPFPQNNNNKNVDNNVKASNSNAASTEGI